MKIAFMFSGQGSQYLGMGKDLYETFSCVRNIFESSKNILGYDIKNIIFDDEEKLNDTKYTQVAMFVLYKSILNVLEKHNIFSEYSFGLSLGEYGAYLHNDIFDFETGLKIVQKRGELMSEAASEGSGKMAAVMGLATEKLLEIINHIDGYVKIANYNTYGQLVISGEEKAVNECVLLSKEAGAKRVIPLNTSGAFHTDLMSPAAKKFEEYLEKVEINNPSKQLLINTTGNYCKQDVKKVMVEQITNSVKFYQIVEVLIKDGVDTFIEIGPKKTLSSFVKKINNDVNILNLEDIESLNKLLSMLEVIE